LGWELLTAIQEKEQSPTFFVKVGLCLANSVKVKLSKI